MINLSTKLHLVIHHDDEGPQLYVSAPEPILRCVSILELGTRNHIVIAALSFWLDNDDCEFTYVHTYNIFITDRLSLLKKTCSVLH